MREFKYDLGQKVEVIASGENGYVKARAQYMVEPNGYLILYKAADGRAVTAWWQENDIRPYEGY